MTHPHQLHALAAAWSLHHALTVLEEWARDWGDTTTTDVSIPSQVFGRRTALGGHGDPTAAAALGAWAPGTPNPHAALLGDMMRELDALAAHLPGAPGQDPLARIRARIPAMRPHVAARTRHALQHLDGKVRDRLNLGPDLTHVPGECPACHARGVLYAHTTDPARPIVCGAGCRCAGDGCPCGMPVRAEGVEHIWGPGTPLWDGLARPVVARDQPTAAAPADIQDIALPEQVAP